MSHAPRQNGDWRLSLIRRRMARTRNDLAEKIELLGRRFRRTAKVVENVTETVQQTVATVQSVAKEPEAGRNPLLALGAVLAKRLLAAAQPDDNALSSRPAPSSETGAGWTQQLAGMLGTEMERFKRQAVGAAVGAARDYIARDIPEPVRPLLRDFARTLTVWLGGDPIPGPVLRTGDGRYQDLKGATDAKRNRSEMAREMGPARRQGETIVGQTHG